MIGCNRLACIYWYAVYACVYRITNGRLEIRISFSLKKTILLPVEVTRPILTVSLTIVSSFSGISDIHFTWSHSRILTPYSQPCFTGPFIFHESLFPFKNKKLSFWTYFSHDAYFLKYFHDKKHTLYSMKSNLNLCFPILIISFKHLCFISSNDT